MVAVAKETSTTEEIQIIKVGEDIMMVVAAEAVALLLAAGGDFGGEEEASAEVDTNQ